MRWLPLLSFVVVAACSSPERTSTPPPARTPSAPAAPVQKMVEQPQQASGASPQTAQGMEPQTPAANVAPAYDFKADTARRIENAKKELGKGITTAVVSDVFVVICPKGWQGKACDDSISLMRSSMAGFMNGRFGKKPAEAISVYLFGDKVGYESFCTQKFNAPCIAHFGFYSPGERYMVMNAGLGLGTLTHEIVHPLVEADFPNAPTWINEGVASVFEQPQIPRPGEIHGGKNWRHPYLKKTMQSADKDKARLDKLFGMPDTTFRGDWEGLNYATARYVCQWLDEKKMLWPFFQKWRDDYANDPTGEKSFVAVTGMTLAEANAAWTKWTLAL